MEHVKKICTFKNAYSDGASIFRYVPITRVKKMN